jgi:hypothetical protein
MCDNDAHTKMGWHRGKRTSNFLWFKLFGRILNKVRVRSPRNSKVISFIYCIERNTCTFILVCIRFGTEQENTHMQKYDGIGKPREHIGICITQWRLVPLEEWPHHFIHRLKGIPINWYTELELHRGTRNLIDLQ